MVAKKKQAKATAVSRIIQANEKATVPMPRVAPLRPTAPITQVEPSPRKRRRMAQRGGIA